VRAVGTPVQIFDCCLATVIAATASSPRAQVERDYETATHATPISGWAGTVWKHRRGSGDMQSGRRGGFRVISVAIKALQQELE